MRVRVDDLEPRLDDADAADVPDASGLSAGAARPRIQRRWRHPDRLAVALGIRRADHAFRHRRHAPLERQHPNALAAAEAAEAAALQGKLPEFSRSLFADQDHQLPSDIIRRARELGLDVDRFEADLSSPKVTGRVRDDMLDAEAMDITSVPTFFVNGVRHVGPYDAGTLVRALTGSEPDPAATQPASRADA